MQFSFHYFPQRVYISVDTQATLTQVVLMTLMKVSPDLHKELAEVTRLRQILHDSFVVEAAGASQGSAQPVSLEAHRTVDGPTLSILKGANYPFSLCEEAPPAYVPPPVPLDIESDIERMKAKVMQVQEDLLNYCKRQIPSLERTRSRSSGKVVITREDVIRFLDSSTTFAELSWEVSSLQWLYRWVLSHSANHLCNAKNQLEYVLRGDNCELPTLEEMEKALQRIPFSEAVTLVDSDRLAMVTQERHRIRSVSRTFRDHLPSVAITAATSSYLNSEEKYMYQEFFNQSEYLLLMLNHKMMSCRASQAEEGMPASMRSPSRPTSERALRTRTSSEEEMTVEDLAKETFNALNAEHDVIKTLMTTIRDRRAKSMSFNVTEKELQRSRTAQISIYGCILSDMNIMARQMADAREFLGKYEEWVGHHGFRSHEELMSILIEREGGLRWPSLPGAKSTNGGNGDPLVSPVDTWRQGEAVKGRRNPSHIEDLSQNVVTGSRSAASRANTNALPVSRRDHPNPPPAAAVQVADPLLPSAKEVAEVYFNVLTEVDGYARSQREPADDLSRLWLIVCFYHTVVLLTRGLWNAEGLVRNLSQAEEELLRLLGRNSDYNKYRSNASALLLLLHQFLNHRHSPGSSSSRSRLVTMDVVVNIHAPKTADLRQVVATALSPEERTRWGAVVDALWFQFDPTARANGGLLMDTDSMKTAASDANAGFLPIARVQLPLAETTTRPATFTITYGINSGAGLSSVSTLTELLNTIKQSTDATSTVTRYLYARQALAALSAIEAVGLLGSYACRLPECEDVSLGDIICGAFNAKAAVAGRAASVTVGVLPPPAMQLMRMHRALGNRYTPAGTADASFRVYAEPLTLSSVGLLLASLLERVATSPPVLKDMYMMAESLKEQSLWEIRNSVVSKCFADTTTHPSPISCPLGKQRLLSIQRDADSIRLTNRPTPCLVAPMLKHMDDYMTTSEFCNAVKASVAESQQRTTPRESGNSVMPSRQTQMMGYGGGRTSRSPSALPPTHH